MKCIARSTIYHPGEILQNYLQVIEIFLLIGKNMITLRLLPFPLDTACSFRDGPAHHGLIVREYPAQGCCAVNASDV